MYHCPMHVATELDISRSFYNDSQIIYNNDSIAWLENSLVARLSSFTRMVSLREHNYVIDHSFIP
jgi:hypothetical protein